MAPAPAAAGPTGWAHQATGFQSNGSVVVKSLAGGTSIGALNPVGAIAKTSQSAAVQPPTVVIQSTGGGPFNYLSDCWIMELPGHVGTFFIGAGKVIDSKFTGITAASNPSTSNGYGTGVQLVVASLLGSGAGSGSIYWCGTDAACAWNYGYQYPSIYGNSWAYSAIMASGMPIVSFQKCYP
jgi:hypothetical protein